MVGSLPWFPLPDLAVFFPPVSYGGKSFYTTATKRVVGEKMVQTQEIPPAPEVGGQKMSENKPNQTPIDWEEIERKEKEIAKWVEELEKQINEEEIKEFIRDYLAKRVPHMVFLSDARRIIADLVEELSKKLGREVTFISYTWPGEEEKPVRNYSIMVSLGEGTNMYKAFDVRIENAGCGNYRYYLVDEKWLNGGGDS